MSLLVYFLNINLKDFELFVFIIAFATILVHILILVSVLVNSLYY